MSVRLLPLVLVIVACGSPSAIDVADEPVSPTPTPTSTPTSTSASGRAEALFAGGCFWCMERAFESLDGVIAVTSGYTGGDEARPTYEQVSGGDTGHFEAVRVVYDPSRITYARLLEVFVRNVDPTQANGQFCDVGRQYRSAIFVADASQRALAQDALDRADRRLDDPVATTILDAKTFWEAEAYHQDFYRTHPDRYASYREGCRRDARLRELWGEAPAH